MICRRTRRSRCTVCSTPPDRVRVWTVERTEEPTDLAAVELDSQALLATVRMEAGRVDMAVVDHLALIVHEIG